jgi:hypothetical protein
VGIGVYEGKKTNEERREMKTRGEGGGGREREKEKREGRKGEREK